MKSKAFTLAEVLITLGIIGVVASMTMPTLIKNYQKHETVNRLKQTYSTLYQAVRMSETDNGTIDTWDIPEDSQKYSIGKEFADKYFTPYLKNIKECKAKDCASSIGYYLDGSGVEATSEKYALVLSNGVTMSFYPRGNLCEIGIDLNGKKGPNTLGKDRFSLVLSKQAISSGSFGIQSKPGLFFYGQGKSIEYLKTKQYACSKTKGTNFRGLFCGALIMQSGWQMPVDYPW